MNMYPIITVLMPAYNAEKYIREAIDSVLAQTFSDFELLIINDGSTDRTEEYVLSYADPRIVYVKNEKNLKLIKTLNRGIDLAKGKFIARIDSDDIILPDRLEKEINVLENNQEISVVSCFPYRISMSGKYLGKSNFFSVTRPFPCKYVSNFESSICHGACLIKTDVIRAFRYNDSPDYLHIEAFDLWNRILHSGYLGMMIPEYLYGYRENVESVCSNFAEEQFERHLKVMKNSIFTHFGLNVSDSSALCIFKRCETKNIVNVKDAFKILDQTSISFIKNEKIGNIADIKEINNWCNQRKLEILLNSITSQFSSIKKDVLYMMLWNIDLFFNLHNIYYLFRIIIKYLKRIV